MKILYALALLVPLVSFGGEGGGVVTDLSVLTTENLVFFRVAGRVKETPRCNEEEMFAINTSTIGGQEQLKLLLLAFEKKYPVKVTGLNTCPGFWKVENVKEITVSAND